MEVEVKSAYKVVDFSSCFCERVMTRKEIAHRSFHEKQLDGLLSFYGVPPRHIVRELMFNPQDKLLQTYKELLTLIGGGWDIGPIQTRRADPEMLEKCGINPDHLPDTWLCIVNATREKQ